MVDKIKNTLIVFVLDETGSMDFAKDGTISGFNEYVNSMKKYGNKVRMTLTKFNSSKTDIVCSSTPIKDVSELNASNYQPTDCTPLYDAIGNSIVNTDSFLVKKADAPAVLFVIMTDGLENASRVYDRMKVFDMIKERKEKGWTFVFLGANQDSYTTSGAISVDSGNAMDFASTNSGVRVACASLASSTAAYLSSGSTSTSAFWSIDLDNREEGS